MTSYLYNKKKKRDNRAGLLFIILSLIFIVLNSVYFFINQNYIIFGIVGIAFVLLVLLVIYNNRIAIKNEIKDDGNNI